MKKKKRSLAALVVVLILATMPVQLALAYSKSNPSYGSTFSSDWVAGAISTGSDVATLTISLNTTQKPEGGGSSVSLVYTGSDYSNSYVYSKEPKSGYYFTACTYIFSVDNVEMYRITK